MVPKRQPHPTQLYQRGGFALDGLRPDSGGVDPRSLFEDVHRPTGDHHDSRDGRERLDQHQHLRPGRKGQGVGGAEGRRVPCTSPTFSFRRDTLKKKVRELVEEILEGGREAFEMRRLKYGF